MGPVRAFRSRHIWAAVAVLAVVSGCSSAAPGDAVASSTGSAQQTTNTSTKTSAASKSVTATALDPSSTWLLVMGTHLEVVRDDGSDRHVAVPSVDTAGRAGDIGLADWSPDGSQIAFTEIIRASQVTDQPRANLWVADSDGPNARQVFECGSACTVRAAPTWSPDGKRLAFAWGRYDEARRVWAAGGVAVGDLASGRAHVVFESTLPSDGVDLVRWSGDGRQLLLSMVESSNNGPDGVPVASRVAVINTAGPPSQRPRPLTPDAIEAGMADWDPRSGRIVYATKVLEQRGQAPTGDANVFSMAADGSDVRRATNIEGAAGWATQPEWTPDGRIIFAHCLAPRVCFVGYVNADGTHLELPQKITGQAPQVKPTG